MSKFDTYFLMKTDDAIEYAKEKVSQIEWDADSMTAKEIGDGNLNYVFKVTDAKGHSVIIKPGWCRGTYFCRYETGYRQKQNRI